MPFTDTEWGVLDDGPGGHGNYVTCRRDDAEAYMRRQVGHLKNMRLVKRTVTYSDWEPVPLDSLAT